MNKHDVLQKIPLSGYNLTGCGYKDTKQFDFKMFNQFYNDGCTVIQSVNGTYYYELDTDMDENGMEKFVAMLAGMLFMIEYGDVDPDQAYGTSYDIKDFETGEYDDLFTPEDLKLIKEDIKTIKEYLSKHPELLKE